MSSLCTLACSHHHQTIVRGAAIGQAHDALAFVLRQAQAVVFSCEYARLGTQAKEAVRRAAFVLNNAFDTDTTAVQQEDIIHACFAKQYWQFKRRFDLETGKRNALTHVYRNLGLLGLLDRVWEPARNKSPNTSPRRAPTATVPPTGVSWTGTPRPRTRSLASPTPSAVSRRSPSSASFSIIITSRVRMKAPDDDGNVRE
jgi:hypothetical protein